MSAVDCGPVDDRNCALAKEECDTKVPALYAEVVKASEACEIRKQIVNEARASLASVADQWAFRMRAPPAGLLEGWTEPREGSVEYLRLHTRRAVSAELEQAARTSVPLEYAVKKLEDNLLLYCAQEKTASVTALDAAVADCKTKSAYCRRRSEQCLESKAARPSRSTEAKAARAMREEKEAAAARAAALAEEAAAAKLQADLEARRLQRAKEAEKKARRSREVKEKKAAAAASLKGTRVFTKPVAAAAEEKQDKETDAERATRFTPRHDPRRRAYEPPPEVKLTPRARGGAHPGSPPKKTRDAPERKTTTPPRDTFAPRAPATTFHVHTLNRAECEKQHQQFASSRGKKVLGTGSFGAVTKVCDRIHPNQQCYALKTSVVGNRDKVEIDRVKRDAYFLFKLRDLRVNGHRAVPLFYDAWSCPGAEPDTTSFHTLMEAYDGDIQKLADTRQEEEGAKSPVYRQAEVLQMFRISAALGIANPDLKPDQFVQRRNGEEIVVVDFGFAGSGMDTRHKAAWGWTSNPENYTLDSAGNKIPLTQTLRCPAALSELSPCSLDACVTESQGPSRTLSGFDLAGYINVITLEANMLLWPILMIPRGAPSQRVPFGGISGLDRDRPENACSAYRNAHVNRNLVPAGSLKIPAHELWSDAARTKFAREDEAKRAEEKAGGEEKKVLSERQARAIESEALQILRALADTIQTLPLASRKVELRRLKVPLSVALHPDKCTSVYAADPLPGTDSIARYYNALLQLMLRVRGTSVCEAIGARLFDSARSLKLI